LSCLSCLRSFFCAPPHCVSAAAMLLAVRGNGSVARSGRPTFLSFLRSFLSFLCRSRLLDREREHRSERERRRERDRERCRRDRDRERERERELLVRSGERSRLAGERSRLRGERERVRSLRAGERERVRSLRAGDRERLAGERSRLGELRERDVRRGELARRSGERDLRVGDGSCSEVACSERGECSEGPGNGALVVRRRKDLDASCT